MTPNNKTARTQGPTNASRKTAVTVQMQEHETGRALTPAEKKTLQNLVIPQLTDYVTEHNISAAQQERYGGHLETLAKARAVVLLRGVSVDEQAAEEHFRTTGTCTTKTCIPVIDYGMYPTMVAQGHFLPGDLYRAFTGANLETEQGRANVQTLLDAGAFPCKRGTFTTKDGTTKANLVWYFHKNTMNATERSGGAPTEANGYNVLA